MWNLLIAENIVKNTILPFEYKDKSELISSPDYVVIDDFDSQSFNRNDCGWIRNDISQLMRAQSREEYDMLLKRLDVSNETGSLPIGISREDAIKRIKPRYAQSQVELQQYAEYVANIDMDAMDEAYRKATENKIDNSTAETSADTPAAE